ncbi:MAG: hypothetical protein IPM17_11645 [Verrucomicrobia bacterium]|jgi:hypothetical protein|nr:hypothetical protein [Verrucomicrobiota bacterium]
MVAPLDLTRLRVLPLAQRKSLSALEEVLVEPADDPAPLSDAARAQVNDCAARIREAKSRGAAVMLIYGAHLVKNGGQLLLVRLLDHGWVTHLATNGAGTIHDWEFSWLGRSTESVRENVATGTFGTWEETGRNIHLALLLGGLRGEGYGRSLGRYIYLDGGDIPKPEELEEAIRIHPADPLTAARADALAAIRRHRLTPGPLLVNHQWRNASPLANAFRHEVPFTVHPGIGYDIITNHPLFNGAVIGRAAGLDFQQFCGSVEALDGGVVLSIGSAIMGPQVFEKALSCVNNLRLQAGRPVVSGHHIYVVDLQDGAGWDWTKGEPPRDNPAYYLRFCKSYSRMGGAMHYVQADNVAFLHHLYHALSRKREN